MAYRETVTRKPHPAVRTAQAPAAGHRRDGAGRFAALQSGLGNRGLSRLLAQLKRDPGRPVQRAELPEEEELQMKRDPQAPAQRAELPDEEEEMQMKSAEGAGSGGRTAGRPNGIPEGVLQKMEVSFGTSFADVNVHVGSEAAEVGALAFTQGNDIHFAPGQYNPESRSGQELLGHELAHVVQQREGRVRANGEVNGVPLNDDPSLEAEADRLGKKAAAGG